MPACQRKRLDLTVSRVTLIIWLIASELGRSIKGHAEHPTLAMPVGFDMPGMNKGKDDTAHGADSAKDGKFPSHHVLAAWDTSSRLERPACHNFAKGREGLCPDPAPKLVLLLCRSWLISPNVLSAWWNTNRIGFLYVLKRLDKLHPARIGFSKQDCLQRWTLRRLRRSRLSWRPRVARAGWDSTCWRSRTARRYRRFAPSTRRASTTCCWVRLPIVCCIADHSIAQDISCNQLQRQKLVPQHPSA